MKMRTGQAAHTLKEIGKRAGVSLGTVSNVLTGAAYVSPKRRELVLAAIRKVGYHPNFVARSLRARRTRILGLVLADITNPFYAQLVRGAEDAALERGYLLLTQKPIHALTPQDQSAVHLARADAQHAALGGHRQPEAFSHPRHPQGQQGLPSHRARIASRLPDCTQHGDHSFAVARRTLPPWRGLPPGVGRRTVQQADGVFPVITAVATKFIQDHLLLLQVRSAITRVMVCQT
jgi:hypothetical protein